MNRYIIHKSKELMRLVWDCPRSGCGTGSRWLWRTVEKTNGYRLEFHKIQGRARVWDRAEEIVLWGKKDEVRQKFNVLTKEDTLEPGDILAVPRAGGVYEHYAVYIGNGRVIHYAGEGGDFSKDISIHEAPIEEFVKTAKNFFVLDFPDAYGEPGKKYSVAASVFSPYRHTLESLKTKKYHLYSPSETVERAKSRIGETKYNLLFGNCEHFAIWCKTGISESHQVNAVLRMIYPLVVEIIE